MNEDLEWFTDDDGSDSPIKRADYEADVSDVAAHLIAVNAVPSAAAALREIRLRTKSQTYSAAVARDAAQRWFVYIMEEGNLALTGLMYQSFHEFLRQYRLVRPDDPK